MKQIDTSAWGEFTVGELFEVSRPAARVRLGYTPGDTPFVSTSSSNNGVSDWVDARGAETELGGCITVSALDGTAFWQPRAFLGRGGAGSSISILRREGLTELAGLFVASAITAACHASYSSMLSGSILRAVTFRLPVEASGAPDWNYMERKMQAVLEDRTTALDRLQGLVLPK